MPADVFQVGNQGTVSGGNFADVLTDDPAAGGSADATVTPVPTADLQVTIDGPDPVNTGETLTYTVVVTNHGPDDVTGAHGHRYLSGRFTNRNLTSVVGTNGAHRPRRLGALQRETSPTPRPICQPAAV